MSKETWCGKCVNRGWCPLYKRVLDEIGIAADRIFNSILPLSIEKFFSKTDTPIVIFYVEDCPKYKEEENV